MKLTVKELQEKAYSFIIEGRGITGSVTVGMIGNCAFSIDDLAAMAFAKRNVMTDQELNDFLELDEIDYSYVEERDALTFTDLSNLDIEEI